jgi:hypothetical protein
MMNMKPVVERFGTLAIVGLPERLDLNTVAMLGEALESHQDAKLVVLDGSIVTAISDEGARLLSVFCRIGARIFNLRGSVRRGLQSRYAGSLPTISLREVMDAVQSSKSETGFVVRSDATLALPARAAA